MEKKRAAGAIRFLIYTLLLLFLRLLLLLLLFLTPSPPLSLCSFSFPPPFSTPSDFPHILFYRFIPLFHSFFVFCSLLLLFLLFIPPLFLFYSIFSFFFCFSFPRPPLSFSFLLSFPLLSPLTPPTFPLLFTGRPLSTPRFSPKCKHSSECFYSTWTLYIAKDVVVVVVITTLIYNSPRFRLLIAHSSHSFLNLHES